MLRLVLSRLVSLAVTLLFVSLAIFLILEVLPGDPAAIMLGTAAREDTLAALRQELGLDRPALVRYLDWVGGILHGDLGTSTTYKMPVSTLVAERMAVTLPLSGLAILISTVLALPLGVAAAARRDGLAWADALAEPALDAFMALGPRAWAEERAWLDEVLPALDTDRPS
ncbi:MAG TPA: hypothetical protein VLJ78_10505, partial [Microvirga sp.]|nr:hypothetical protein [Microvirga sp.]